MFGRKKDEESAEAVQAANRPEPREKAGDAKKSKKRKYKSNVSMNEVALVVFAIGTLSLLAAYFLAYRPMTEKAEQIEEANTVLTNLVGDLQGKTNHKDEYIELTEQIKQDIQDIYDRFPADVREEDVIKINLDLEDYCPMLGSAIGFGDTVPYYTVGQGPTNGEAVAADPEEVVGETSLEDDVATAMAGGTTEYAESYDFRLGTPTLPGGYEGEYGPIVLYDTPANYTFETSYTGIKNFVNYFTSNQDRMTVQSINLAYDASTGLLNGSAAANLYSLSGTGKVYEYPDIPNVQIGTRDIFASASLSR